jgi:mannose-6-phosphate isomerase-like protein (cupin superfamily)
MGRVWHAHSVGTRDGGTYAEFLRVPAVSVGIYRLAAGSSDAQQPHREDEIYVVLNGAAKLRHGSEVDEMGPGSVAFVPGHEEHRFEDITEDLEVLVIFAPPESQPST